MAAHRPLRLAPEWDDRFTRMVVVSAVLHVGAIVATVWLLAGRGGPTPVPLVAYTVEITDPSALGGRVPSGLPGQPPTGGPAPPPAPEPRPEAVEPPKGEEAKAPEPPPEEKPPPAPEPVEAKPEPKPEPPVAPPPTEPTKRAAPEEPEVHVAEKPKPPEPKPVEKPPEPKPPPKPPEPKPEPPKTASAKPTSAKPTPPKPEPHATTKPEAAGKPGAPAGKETHDDYAAAAERWRARAAKPNGGGLGGADTGSGPIGSGGQGPGGGGQLVGLEFISYRQQVINTVKARWTNVIARPGLVVTIHFEIGPDGDVSGVRVEQSSGNAAYDASAVRAVQRATPLPPPPARYVKEFREFQIEFHSEEQGGQGAG